MESVVQDRLRERSLEEAKLAEKWKREEDERAKQFDMITSNQMIMDPFKKELDQAQRFDKAQKSKVVQIWPLEDIENDIIFDLL